MRLLRPRPRARGAGAGPGGRGPDGLRTVPPVLRGSPYGYDQPYVYERRTYVPRRYVRRDRGSAAAAGIAGLAAGALIGGAIASQQAQAAPAYEANQSAVAYCMQRFRFYDPASGPYLGYDGLRRTCP